MNWEVKFTDCHEFDKTIDAEQRWLATNDHLKISVTAPTKEQAFEEVMTSVRVMAAHASGLSPMADMEEKFQIIERVAPRFAGKLRYDSDEIPCWVAFRAMEEYAIMKSIKGT